MDCLEKLLKSGSVKGLCDDSRKVKSGDLFFAFPVATVDDFVRSASAAGAVAIVAQTEKPEGVTCEWVTVASVKEARKFAAETFYNNPFKTLKVHAVTGTNGKTTSAFLMREMLAASGRVPALLGTICSRIGDKVVPSSLTTPGLLELYAFARTAVDAGATDLVMEASSHSLVQGRMDGIRYESALFSNLTQDHLDYHKTFENYFQAKLLLFTKYLADKGVAVINIDDEYGMRIADIFKSRKVLVSRLGNARADIKPNVAPVIAENGTEISLPQVSTKSLHTRLCGEFNVDNVMLVTSWAFALGISEDAIRSALQTVKVPGRFEKVYDENGKHVIVDYAHTPDALERVLKTARTLCKGSLNVVFGCGGDRDKTKRPIMGGIAEANADKVYVTSDNPRTENPEEILKDIMAGMKGNYQLEADRAKAIKLACSELNSGDWLVVAGKGHEDYQIIGTVKHHFDDAEEVRKAFA